MLCIKSQEIVLLRKDNETFTFLRNGRLSVPTTWPGYYLSQPQYTGDGWEFLEEKETNALCKDVKIALLTSSSHPYNIEKVKRYSSVVAYFEKPLTKEMINSLLTQS